MKKYTLIWMILFIINVVVTLLYFEIANYGYAVYHGFLAGISFYGFVHELMK